MSDVVEVPLTRGYIAIVDASDAPGVLRHKWHALVSKTGNVYAVRNKPRATGRGCIYLHRELMQAPSGVEVDHANRQTLDCRRANMRFATRSQQVANTRSRARHGFKGIVFSKGKWQAAVKINGESRYLGRFDTAEQAARVRDAACLALFGAFAVLNFPVGVDVEVV